MIGGSQFTGIITKLFPNGIPPSVIALSGGVDSMCLTYLLAQHKKNFQPDMELHAVTIDHSYRKGSDVEAQRVGDVVSQWGVPHTVCKLNQKDVHDISNFEEVARVGRYDLFNQQCERLGAKHIFLAHNLNDQFETYLFRLMGNSSLLGLRGLRSVSYAPVTTHTDTPQILIRPLLQFPKLEIIETCERNGVTWFEDPTNKDIDLTARNKLRYIIDEYVPELEMHDAYFHYNCITKGELSNTHDKIVKLDDYITNQATYLQEKLTKEGRFVSVPAEGRVKFVFSFDEWKENSIEVLSRLVYGNIHPIAPYQYFHWAYTKLERRCLPFFMDFFNRTLKSPEVEGLKREHFTSFNLKFEFTVDEITRNVILDVFRQNVKPEIPASFTKNGITDGADSSAALFLKLEKERDDFDKWWLWDLRYWIKVASVEGDVVLDSIEIVPYIHKLHSHYLKDLNIKKPSLNNDPFIIAQFRSIKNNDVITSIALPTRGITTNELLKVEYKLKKNLYPLGGIYLGV